VRALTHRTPTRTLCVRDIMREGAAGEQAYAAALSASGALRATDAAWLLDFQHGHAAALTLLAAAEMLLSRERMGPLRTFLDVADAVLVALVAYVVRADTAFGNRLTWQRAMCAQLGAAAGCAATELAAVPWIVGRFAALAHSGGGLDAAPSQLQHAGAQAAAAVADLAGSERARAADT
jgi:hypothetical protein